MAERIGGWLLLLCRLLVVFHPLALAVTASNALNSLSSPRATAVALILILRLAVVGFGMAAGRALQTLQPGAVTLAKAALFASAATDVFVYVTPYFPNNRIPGDTPLYVAATLAYHGGWLLYLRRSKRVQTTFTP